MLAFIQELGPGIDMERAAFPYLFYARIVPNAATNYARFDLAPGYDYLTKRFTAFWPTDRAAVPVPRPLFQLVRPGYGINHDPNSTPLALVATPGQSDGGTATAHVRDLFYSKTLDTFYTAGEPILIAIQTTAPRPAYIDLCVWGRYQMARGGER